MLKLARVFILLTMIWSVASWTDSPSAADSCTAENSKSRSGATISVSCTSTRNSSSQGSGSTSTQTGCSTSGGKSIPCDLIGYPWNTYLQSYCKVSVQNRISTTGRVLYDCLYQQNGMLRIIPLQGPLPTTPLPSVDPEALTRTAVAKLGLVSPTIGVGAYVYPGYETWGLTWWVGAPLWLWVDSSDSHQWGTHTLSVSEQGTTISATVTATSVSFNPGDGTSPVRCSTPGVSRPWNPNELINRVSPVRCQHIYVTPNRVGDPTSRYVVSASTTWTTVWRTSSGKTGSFTTTTTSMNNPSIHVGQLAAVSVPNPGD